MVEVNRCPRCQGHVSVDAPEGLCPECLLHQALEGQAGGPDQPEDRRSPFPVFVPPPPAELAQHFPQLEILALVGQGGMGAVYRARQTKLDRLVALKVLPPEVARDSAFAERFTREARSLARLNHPNVVTIFDFGETDGLYYFTMEFVDGQNVRQLVEAGGLAAQAALRIAMQVCDALQYAHDEGLVHRDIKPENILLDRKGRVKIADFGLARLVGLTPAYLTLTGSREVMGTLYYMAPEQMRRSHRVDHRADLFSLGVVLYEMLTGELPVGRFGSPSHKARVDRRLDAIVLKALAREPEQRYQDAAELKRDLEAVLAGGQAAAARGPQPAEAAGMGNLDSFLGSLFQQPLPQPAGPGRIGDWPTVRFTIPRISWLGAEARGEIYRDNEALLIEFQERWAVWRSNWRQLRIPFRELTSLSCQTESWLRLPKMPHWVRNWQTTELIIKTTHHHVLAGLPVGKAGRGRLLVHWGDRDAARQLVESVVRQAAPVPGSRVPLAPEATAAPSPPERQVLAPALGLLLSAVVALVSSFIWSTVLVYEIHDAGYLKWGHVAGMFASWLGAWAGAYLFFGALQMARRRSYRIALTAACLALLPWSPGWLLALPFGIWAVVVLRRPEVIAAFRKGGRVPVAAAVPGPAARGVLAGRMRSLIRSVRGYFVSVSTGRPGGVAGQEEDLRSRPTAQHEKSQG